MYNMIIPYIVISNDHTKGKRITSCAANLDDKINHLKAIYSSLQSSYKDDHKSYQLAKSRTYGKKPHRSYNTLRNNASTIKKNINVPLRNNTY